MKLIRFFIDVLIITIPIFMWVIVSQAITIPTWYSALCDGLLLLGIIMPFIIIVVNTFNDWWDNQLKHTGKL